MGNWICMNPHIETLLLNETMIVTTETQIITRKNWKLAVEGVAANSTWTSADHATLVVGVVSASVDKVARLVPHAKLTDVRHSNGDGT